MSEWIENQMAGMTKNEERLCDEIDARRWVEKILSFTKSELEDSKREKLVLDAEIEKLAAEVKSLKAEREQGTRKSSGRAKRSQFGSEGR